MNAENPRNYILFYDISMCKTRTLLLLSVHIGNILKHTHTHTYMCTPKKYICMCVCVCVQKFSMQGFCYFSVFEISRYKCHSLVLNGSHFYETE